jgi:hypothetical protein
MWKDAAKTTIKVGLEASFFMHIQVWVGTPKSKNDFWDSLFLLLGKW